MTNTTAYMDTLAAAICLGDEGEATFTLALAVVGALILGKLNAAEANLRLMDTAPREYLLDALKADNLI